MLGKEPSIELMLLDKSGVELVKIPRVNNSGIKILAQTAYVQVEDINHFRYAGCDDFIAKLIETTKLFSLIDNSL